MTTYGREIVCTKSFNIEVVSSNTPTMEIREKIKKIALK
jgi:hypothetical protein